MQPDAILNKLLLLTLTLEEALRHEDFAEADSLFHQRDLTLSMAATLGISKDDDTVKMILEADKRLGLYLATRSKETVNEIRRVQNQGKAQRAYSHAS